MLWNRDRILQSFKTYTDAYDASDPKIKLKIDHTYRVASLSKRIATSLNLSKDDILLAWTCGMLHDIGRFEQVRRYHTFFDAESVDHATFGADLLFKEGLLSRFIEPDGEAAESAIDILEKAIRVHSLFRLPELTERELLFATILRDADKIDILKVNTQTRPEDVYNVTTEQLKSASVSKEVKEAFDEHHCAKRSDRTSAIDYLVGHACLVYELVHPISTQIVFEQGYIYQLLSYQSENPDTIQWFAHMREAMRELELSLHRQTECNQ